MMVWAGNWATSKPSLVFVDVGVKIDESIYSRDILDAVVPWTRGAILADSNGHFYKIPLCSH